MKKSSDTLVRQHGLVLDPQGLLRCKGRLGNSLELSLEEREPILLAQDDLAKLIVQDCHIRSLHSGVRSTLVLLRNQFWLPNGRKFVTNFVRKCVPCKKVSAKPYCYPDPPALPTYRVISGNPFSAVGIDYTRYLLVRNGVNTTKTYIAVFACCITRAIHLELVSDLTAEQFVLAFRRFAARRSLPTTVVTDNATYFVAGNTTIKETLDQSFANDFLQSYNIRWIHVPGRCPAWGGMYERLVGLVKQTLRKVLGKCLVSKAELETIITETEAAVNNRPITYVEETSSLSPEALTPSHLLHGCLINTLPHYGSTDDPDLIQSKHGQLTQRVNYRNSLMHQIWNRWRTEYLNFLRERKANFSRKTSTILPKVGDIVIIHDDNPRVEWKIGKVTDLIPGKDGEERVAKVLSNKTELTRATYKLYPLEVNAMTDTSDSTIDCKDGSSTEHPEQSDALIKERRQAFRNALTKLQSLAGDSGGGGSIS